MTSAVLAAAAAPETALRCSRDDAVSGDGWSALLPAALIVSFYLLAGCTGRIPETRYYLLSEPQEAALPATAAEVVRSSTARAALRLLAVRLPDYLETRSLVVALEDNRIQPATYHQWAEPLVAGLERYLSAALETATADLDSPGPPALLTVTMNHLHGSEAGAVVLDAQWALESPEDRSVLQRGRIERVLQQHEPGYPALVATHRQLLDALAAAIVAQWRSASGAAG